MAIMQNYLGWDLKTKLGVSGDGGLGQCEKHLFEKKENLKCGGKLQGQGKEAKESKPGILTVYIPATSAYFRCIIKILKIISWEQKL